MTDTTQRKRILRTLAATAGAVALAMTVSACADSSDDTRPEKRDFALDGTRLTIDAADSAVVVRPADVHDVEVTRWFDGWSVLGDTPKATWSMDGHTLKFRVSCQGVMQNCSARHEVLVPRDVTVTVTNGDGRVEASGFTTPLTLTTKDGSVRVRDVTGPLELSSGDGRIEATGLNSRRVTAHTSDGSLTLAFVRAPDSVEARSGDGSVRVSLPKQGYKVSASSGDGHVRVDVPRDDHSPRTVTVRTSDGSVNVVGADAG
ncbi:DUF4097 family beta strand repeat-containing protein [Streptomyces sp. NPDC002574]|uniref:DUF4097 family beta strand repeat-containing protein n=1 Tax=Streptomyces sp. NPDC002574 TaxID=3364652 RepID=UPI00367D06D3